MLNLIENHLQMKPSSIQFKFFKDVGFQPFNEFEFSKYNIFHIYDFLIRNQGSILKQANFLEQ